MAIQRAKLIIKCRQNADGTYTSSGEVPMSLADEQVSQDLAFHSIKYINGMLAFSKSKYQVVFYDTVEKSVATAK